MLKTQDSEDAAWANEFKHYLDVHIDHFLRVSCSYIHLILRKKKVGYAILLIFTHHHFFDTFVENQIPKDLSVVFHVWAPFVNVSQWTMRGFPWPREEWKGNMADNVSRAELAKTSWIASTNYVFSKQ